MINLEVNLSIMEACVEVPNLGCDLKMVNPDPLLSSSPATLQRASTVIMSEEGCKSMQRPVHGNILLLLLHVGARWWQQS